MKGNDKAMTIDKDDLLGSILESLSRVEYIKPADIPNIDLYMDQVTSFMDHKLRNTARNPGENRVMTKTMINNYAKNDFLPPPVKKKYSKEHVLVLIFIYYFKNILSINDIRQLLKPITERYFQSDKEFNLESVYEEVFHMEKEQLEILKEDVKKKFNKAEETFQDAPKEEAEFLRRFSFICLLSFDVYVKKLIIEEIIDEMLPGERNGKREEEKKEKKES